jgi:hypothetical protein
MATKDELIAEATELGLETEGMSKGQIESAIAAAKKEDAVAEVASQAAVAAASDKKPSPEGAKLYTVKNKIVAGGFVYRAGETAALTDIQAKPLLKYGVIELITK